jgi:hypothetical protein
MNGQPPLFDQAGQREFHPLTRLLPPPEASEDVVASIAAALAAGRNYLDMWPITLDQDGRIVDGRLRYLACLRSGTKPVYETLGAHCADAMVLEFIRSRNVRRQHLSPDQRAIILADYERMREQAGTTP